MRRAAGGVHLAGGPHETHADSLGYARPDELPLRFDPVRKTLRAFAGHLGS